MKIKMDNDKENVNELSQLIFVNEKSNDKIIFDEKEPIIVLIDILKPIVKVENCTWLEEV